MENMITKKFNEKDVVNEGIVQISIDIEQEKLKRNCRVLYTNGISAPTFKEKNELDSIRQSADFMEIPVPSDADYKTYVNTKNLAKVILNNDKAYIDYEACFRKLKTCSYANGCPVVFVFGDHYDCLKNTPDILLQGYDLVVLSEHVYKKVLNHILDIFYTDFDKDTVNSKILSRGAFACIRGKYKKTIVEHDSEDAINKLNSDLNEIILERK